MMTAKLLISVRSAEEAREAVAGGASVIDIKEPRNGPLGAANRSTWNEVRTVVAEGAAAAKGLGGSELVLSAAMGELLERRDPELTAELQGFAYAKIGLAGCRSVPDWMRLWRDWIDELPETCSPVAVVYADSGASAPEPLDVLAAARTTRARALLIDTCDKSRGDLWQWMDDGRLAELVTLARQERFKVALAGSLSLETLPRAMRFQPDWIAVRGAVCRAGRDSLVDRECVNHFFRRLSTPRIKKQKFDSAK
jgi:uncharacterized protein (UPF0264 family)